jgi:hypothetical protein
MNVVEDAIYDTLFGHAPLAALVSTRIYRQRAPQGATYPHVVYGLQGGGDENLTPNDSQNLLYAVRFVAEASPDDAGDGADLIRTALHRQTLTVSGAVNFWTAAQAYIRFTETDERTGKTYYHAGAIYRIRVD